MTRAYFAITAVAIVAVIVLCSSQWHIAMGRYFQFVLAFPLGIGRGVGDRIRNNGDGVENTAGGLEILAMGLEASVKMLLIGLETSAAGLKTLAKRLEG